MDSSRLYEAILAGDSKAAVAATEQALREGTDPVALVSSHMIPAMDEVGRRFETEEYFVPELLIAGRAMKAALTIIRPLLAATGAQPVGRVVIGTVKGDLHDIGKNLVASMLEGGGFEVYDLGADVPPEGFIEAARSRNADIVALSALLTVTMPSMKSTVEALHGAALPLQPRIIVGGAPVTRQYAEEIGADGYSDSASSAVTLARSLMEGHRQAAVSR
jgi:5-methyltetrahydrofolate--homocysteine methyltransferase